MNSPAVVHDQETLWPGLGEIGVFVTSVQAKLHGRVVLPKRANMPVWSNWQIRSQTFDDINRGYSLLYRTASRASFELGPISHREACGVGKLPFVCQNVALDRLVEASIFCLPVSPDIGLSSATMSPMLRLIKTRK